MAYVLGFFCADGSMDLTKRGTYYFSIQICDQVLLESIRDVLESNHAISIRPGRGPERDKYRLQIGSKEMCSDLMNLGIQTQKTQNLTLPKVPEKYLGSFVRGYFDGDGNVWTGTIHKERKTSMKSIHTVFTSASGEFLKALQSRLGSRGITGQVACRKTFYRLSYSILSSLKLYELMYTNLGTDLCLDRKKDIFESYIRERMQS